MILAVILLGICQFVGFVGFCWYLRLYFDRKQAQIVESVNAELAKLVAGEPCQSAAVLNAIGEHIGSVAGRTAKASLMADLSHVNRNANLDASDAQAAEIGSRHPALAAALGSLGPRSKKGLLNNPILQLAFSALTGGGPGGGDTGNNHGGTDVKGRIGRG